MFGGDSLILLDIMRVEFNLHVFSHHYNPLINLVILDLCVVCVNFFFHGTGL
jgi:hypothetical protein